MTHSEAEIKRETFFKPIEKLVFDVLTKSNERAISLIDTADDLSADAILRQPFEDMYIKIYSIVGLFFANETQAELVKAVTIDDVTLARIEAWVKANAGERVTDVWMYSREQYLNVLKEATATAIDSGQSVDSIARMVRDMVSDRMGEISLMRATRIARTEIVSASNMGSLQGAMNSQATVKKSWLTSGLPGTRPTHLDAEAQPPIELNQTFKVGADDLQYPGDPAGSPAEVINCRCTIIYNRV